MQKVQFSSGCKPCKVRRPCYIAGLVDTDWDKRAGLMEVRCKLVFPSTDPALIDRGNIVNSAVCLLGVWNLTNVASELLRGGRFIAQEFRVESLRFIRPDQEVTAVLSAIELRRDAHGRLGGKAKASLHAGGILATQVWVDRFTELRE